MARVENILSRAPMTRDQKSAVGRLVGELSRMRRGGLPVEKVVISEAKEINGGSIHMGTNLEPFGMMTVDIAMYMGRVVDTNLFVVVRGKGFEAKPQNAKKGEKIILFDFTEKGVQASKPLIPVLGSGPDAYLLE